MKRGFVFNWLKETLICVVAFLFPESTMQVLSAGQGWRAHGSQGPSYTCTQLMGSGRGGGHADHRDLHTPAHS